MQIQVHNENGVSPQEVFAGGAPPGDAAFACAVTSSDVAEAKDGEGQNWVVKATVMQGPHAGSQCQSYMGLPRGDSKDGGRIAKIGGMLVALGLRTEAQAKASYAFDTNEALGKNCVVYVTEKGTNAKGQRDTEQTFVFPQNHAAALAGQWNPKDAARNAGKANAAPQGTPQGYAPPPSNGAPPVAPQAAVPPPAAAPAVGTVMNGHTWNGAAWIPNAAPAAPAPPAGGGFTPPPGFVPAN